MSADVPGFDCRSTFVHLEDGGAAEALSVGEHFWRDVLGRATALDRLLGVIEMTEDTPHWERHPGGEELLFALSGRFDAVLELSRGDQVVALPEGRALLVPRGVWHRLRVREPGRLLFVTPGEGTEHRAVSR